VQQNAARVGRKGREIPCKIGKTEGFTVTQTQGGRRGGAQPNSGEGRETKCSIEEIKV